jgi:hypothetical protein
LSAEACMAGYAGWVQMGAVCFPGEESALCARC